MIIDVLNRMLGLIEEVQVKDEKHAKADAEISEMLYKQREQIKLLLDRIERLENKNRNKQEQEQEQEQEQT